MTSIFARAGLWAALGLGVFVANTPSAQATGERVGEYLKRHHVDNDHGKRIHHRRHHHRHGHAPSRFADEPDVYRIIRIEPERSTRVYFAPVRHAPLGDQVRLESGSWQYCEATCEYTFRKYGPDFWESQAEGEIYPRTLRFDFHLDH
jgi:hypothetical protein